MIKKISTFLMCLLVAFTCFASTPTSTLTVHADAEFTPDLDHCDPSLSRYCYAMKNYRDSGVISRDDVENIWKKASDDDLYKLGTYFGNPSDFLPRFVSDFRNGVNRISNGFADSAFGTTNPDDFNLTKCLWTGKNCVVKYSGGGKYENNSSHNIGVSNPSDSYYRNYYTGIRNSNNTINFTPNIASNNHISAFSGNKLSLSAKGEFSFRVGETKNYRIVNDNSKRINYYNNNYDIQNNTYNTYNNYNTNYYTSVNYDTYFYNVKYNTYNYVSNYNNTNYYVTNNYNSSTVTVIDESGATVSYKYYFELPNGSNSFNMTEEDIKGIKLDYHVENYNNIYDNEGLLGLWHFDGNIFNSAYGDVKLKFSNGSSGYLNDEATHFNDYIIFKYNTSLNFDNLDFSKVKSFEFRFKPFKADTFDISFLEGYDGKKNVWKKTYIYGYHNSVWNHLLVDNIQSDGTCTVYLNGTIYHWVYDKFRISDLKNFYIRFNLVDYSLSTSTLYLDEFRILDRPQHVGEQSFSVSNLPYDTNLTYVLPKVDNNNTILIQSVIPVNTTQFGGKRSSLPDRGDVYLAINDKGIIEALEQYDGADWRLINSSVYVESLGKWQDIIGRSIYNGKIDNSSESDDTSSSSSNSISEDFFTKKFKEVTQALDDISSIIKDIKFTIHNLVNDDQQSLLKKMFVPQFDRPFNEIIDDKKKGFKEKVGILYLPFEFSDSLFKSFQNAQDDSYIISFEQISLMGVPIISANSFDLKKIVSSSSVFSDMYMIYQLVVRGIIYSLLLKMIFNKVMGVLKK